jgi:hypothetical protein
MLDALGVARLTSPLVRLRPSRHYYYYYYHHHHHHYSITRVFNICSVDCGFVMSLHIVLFHLLVTWLLNQQANKLLLLYYYYLNYHRHHHHRITRVFNICSFYCSFVMCLYIVLFNLLVTWLLNQHVNKLLLLFYYYYYYYYYIELSGQEDMFRTKN